MTDYRATVRRHRRLAILRHLAACPEYTANVSILDDMLNGVGLPSTRDQVVTEITWLAENGFAVSRDYEGFVVASATQAGIEIANGEASHPEIQRPAPRF